MQALADKFGLLNASYEPVNFDALPEEEVYERKTRMALSSGLRRFRDEDWQSSAREVRRWLCSWLGELEAHLRSKDG